MLNEDPKTAAIEVSNTAVINELKTLSQVLRELGVQKQAKLDELILTLKTADEALDSRDGFLITSKYARELVEAHQLCPISRWATTSLRSAAPKTWQRILRDSSDLMNSRQQTDPRNWQYELHLCSRLLAANLDATWPNVEREPDIRVSVDGRQIAIEAKRPAGENSVERNVSKAVEQLFDGPLPREPETVGLIAISLDLCLLQRYIRPASLPDGRHLDEVYHYPTGETDDDMARPFAQLWETLIELPKIRKLRGNPRIAGILFTGCYPAVLRRPDGSPHLCAVSRMAIPFASSPKNKTLLWKLVSALGTVDVESKRHSCAGIPPPFGDIQGK